jgi:GWxTD domain-containing protein
MSRVDFSAISPFFRLQTARLFQHARLGGLVVLLLLVAKELPAAQQLSDVYRQFLEKDAVYIITDREREQFLTLSNDAERDAFIENFWRIRDPIPETLANEFKEEHFKRIAEANQKFSESREGWRTDRGRMYIVLGPPNDIMSYPSSQELYPLEIWFYERLDLPKFPPSLQFMFFRRNGVGEYRLFSPAFDGFRELMADRVARGLVPQTGYVPFEFRKYYDLEIIKAAEGVAPGYSPQASEEIIAITQTPGVFFERLVPSYATRVSADVSFTNFPVEFQAVYFKGDGDFSEVHLSLEIAPEDLRVNQYEKVMRGRVDLYGTVLSLRGEAVDEFRDTAEITIEEGDWERAQRFPFLYERKLSLLPGRYKLKLVVRDFVTRRFATVERVLSVPDFPSDRICVSSVLGAFKADDIGSAEPSRPHSFGHLRFYPKPGVSFGQNQRILAFLEVYYPPAQFDTGAPDQPTISARFILRRDEQTVLDEINRYGPDMSSPGSVAILKGLPSELLDPGAYTLEALLSEETSGFNELARLDFTVEGPQEVGRLSTVGLEQPEPAEKFLRQGHKYLVAGDYENAIPRFQAALDYDPSLQSARLGKARAQIYAGNPASGEETARDALKREPEDFEAVTVVGLALYRQGLYAKAAASYQEAVKLGGESVTLLNALGEAELQAGNVEAAWDAFSRSLQLEPDQAEVKEILDQMEKTAGRDKQPY